MPGQHNVDDTQLVSDLNDLIQLDRDATEAYTVAINGVQDPRLSDALVLHRGQHQRHVEELAALVRGRGGYAIEMPHITGPFKMAVQAMGGATRRDENVLFALRVVESQVREKYTRYAARQWPADVEVVVRRNADDEHRHYRWILDELQARNYGDDSLAGTVAAVAEAMHKMVATPIESISKRMMRTVGDNLPWTLPTRQADPDGAPESSEASVRHFEKALRAVEERGDVEWMVSLFASDAQLTSPLTPAGLHGPDGAREYWMAYRGAFAQLHTTMNQTSAAAGVVTLQWTIDGTTASGAVLRMHGVSVLHYRGTQITKLQMFFDPTPLAAAVAPAPTGASIEHAASGST